MKLLVLVAMLLCAACDDDNAPCDPGQTYAHGVCHAPVDAGAIPADGVPHD